MSYDRKKRTRDDFLENTPGQLFKRRGRTHLQISNGMGQHLLRKGNKYLPVDSMQPMNRDPRGHFLQSVPSSLFRTGANVNLSKPPVLQSDPLFETVESQTLNTLRLNVESPQIRRITARALQRVNYAPQIDKWMKNRSALDPDRQPILQGTAPWKTSDNVANSNEVFDDGGTYSQRNSLPLFAKASGSRGKNSALFGRRTVANLAPSVTGYMMTERDKRIALDSALDVGIASATQQKNDFLKNFNRVEWFLHGSVLGALVAAGFSTAALGPAAGVKTGLLTYSVLNALQQAAASPDDKSFEMEEKAFHDMVKYAHGASKYEHLFRNVGVARFSDEEMAYMSDYNPQRAAHVARRLPSQYVFENGTMRYIGSVKIDQVTPEEIEKVKQAAIAEFNSLQDSKINEYRKKQEEAETLSVKNNKELQDRLSKLESERDEKQTRIDQFEDRMKQLKEEQSRLESNHATSLELAFNKQSQERAAEELKAYNQGIGQTNILLNKLIAQSQISVPNFTPNIGLDDNGLRSALDRNSEQMSRFVNEMIRQRESHVSDSMSTCLPKNPLVDPSTLVAPKIKRAEDEVFVGPTADGGQLAPQMPTQTVYNTPVPVDVLLHNNFASPHNPPTVTAAESAAVMHETPAPADTPMEDIMPTSSDLNGPWTQPPAGTTSKKETITESGDSSLNSPFAAWKKQPSSGSFNKDLEELTKLLDSVAPTWAMAKKDTPLLKAYVLQRNLENNNYQISWDFLTKQLQTYGITDRLSGPHLDSFGRTYKEWGDGTRREFMMYIIKMIDDTGKPISKNNFLAITNGTIRDNQRWLDSQPGTLTQVARFYGGTRLGKALTPTLMELEEIVESSAKVIGEHAAPVVGAVAGLGKRALAYGQRTVQGANNFFRSGINPPVDDIHQYVGTW